jgi:hypothetical protein
MVRRPPVGRAFMVRRFILSRSDIFKGRWRIKDVGPEGTDLRRQTGHHTALAQRAYPWTFTVGRPPVGRAFMVRRFILSRSDIFKGRWRTKDVGPEGTDLRKQTGHHTALAQRAYLRALMVRQPSTRKAKFRSELATERLGPFSPGTRTCGGFSRPGSSQDSLVS